METQNSSFSNLPHDLLSDISERLGLINLLCFHSLCKIIRFASSDSSATIEEQSSSQSNPWFLLYGEGPHCSIVTNSNTNHRRRYKINLLEIADSTVVASLAGWLLCLSRDSSMFFFCPFSKSRINLPNCPFASTDLNFVAAFSDSPTNRDCAVVVFRRGSDILFNVELCFLRRGDSEWSRHQYYHHLFQLGLITNVIHHKGAFHFLDDSKVRIGPVLN